MSNMDVLQIRNMKDFLLLYNQISETCFKRCTDTFFSRDITAEEDTCIKNCAEKHVHANHKIMEIFMEIQPTLVQKRIEEAQSTQAALEAQSAQAALKTESTQTPLESQSTQASLEDQIQPELQTKIENVQEVGITT